MFDFDSKSSHVAQVCSIISPNTCSALFSVIPPTALHQKTTTVFFFCFFFSVRQLSGRLQPPLSDIGALTRTAAPWRRRLLSSQSQILRIPSAQGRLSSWRTAGAGVRLRMERRRSRRTRRETWIVPGSEILGEIQSVWKKESGHQQPSSHPRPLSFGRLLPERCPFAEKCQAHHIPPATQWSSLGSAAPSDKG